MGTLLKLLEVKKDGKTFFQTESKECIPPNDVLKSMKKSGYKVYMNGKIWKESNKKE